MSDDPRSAMIQDGNIMRIENALVEETFCFNDSSGYIIVSYSVPVSYTHLDVYKRQARCLATQ